MRKLVYILVLIISACSNTKNEIITNGLLADSFMKFDLEYINEESVIDIYESKKDLTFIRLWNKRPYDYANSTELVSLKIITDSIYVSRKLFFRTHEIPPIEDSMVFESYDTFTLTNKIRHIIASLDTSSFNIGQEKNCFDGMSGCIEYYKKTDNKAKYNVACGHLSCTTNDYLFNRDEELIKEIDSLTQDSSLYLLFSYYFDKKVKTIRKGH